jgi:hypothetical protein
MKTLTTLFALAIFCATAYGQTIKTLGYNTTNGEVVANTGTNVLTFTNTLSIVGNLEMTDGASIDFDDGDFFITAANIFLGGPFEFSGTNSVVDAGITRTNLGLYATNSAAVFAALALWDDSNSEFGMAVQDAELTISQGLVSTNAPTDATNAVRWIRVNQGTNSYRIPLYQ